MDWINYDNEIVPIIRSWQESRATTTYGRIYSGLHDANRLFGSSRVLSERPSIAELVTLSELLVRLDEECPDVFPVGSRISDNGILISEASRGAYSPKVSCFVGYISPYDLNHIVISTFAHKSAIDFCGPSNCFTLAEAFVDAGVLRTDSNLVVNCSRDSFAEQFCSHDRLDWRIEERRNMVSGPRQSRSSIPRKPSSHFAGQGNEVRQVDITGATEDVAAELIRLQELISIRVLSLSGCDVRREHIALINALPGVEEVRLVGSEFPQELLRNLCDLNAPRVAVHLYGATDSDLLDMGRSDKIVSLALTHPQLTLEGMSAIPLMRRLQTFDISNCDLPSHGIRELAEIEGLARLGIAACQCEHADLADIQYLRDLHAVTLNYTTAVDNDICIRLACLPKLAEVRVDGTSISDSGLIALSSCATLLTLSIRNTFGVTRGGICSLKSLVPSVVLRV